MAYMKYTVNDKRKVAGCLDERHTADRLKDRQMTERTLKTGTPTS